MQWTHLKAYATRVVLLALCATGLSPNGGLEPLAPSTIWPCQDLGPWRAGSMKQLVELSEGDPMVDVCVK